MPIATAPPNPWQDPKAYILWLFERLELIAAVNPNEQLMRLLESEADTIAKLRLEPPESETPES